MPLPQSTMMNQRPTHPSPILIPILLLLLAAVVQSIPHPPSSPSHTTNNNNARAETETYRAAVVEYAPDIAKPRQLYTRQEALDLMLHNLHQCERLLMHHGRRKEDTATGSAGGYQRRYADRPADIVVLPEYALFGPVFGGNRTRLAPFLERIPWPNGYASRSRSSDGGSLNPCLQSGAPSMYPVLHAASCMARRHSIVLVLNVAEVHSNSSSSRDMQELNSRNYNTNIAFDESGALVAKYRKTHLYYETHFDAGDGKPVAFETSFGVRFGLMICFDLMFSRPALALLHEQGIRDLVFSSWWVNYPPVINALQMQQGFSTAFGVNLLASNAGSGWRNSGSGIFSNGKTLASYYTPDAKWGSRVLIADVPIGGDRHTSAAAITDTGKGRHQHHLSNNNINNNINNNDNNRSNNSSDVHERPQISLDIFEAQPGSRHTLRADTADIECRAMMVVGENHHQQEPAYFALMAKSGQLFPVLRGSTCVLMRCGTSASRCESVAKHTLYTMRSDTMFDAFHIEARSLRDPKVVFFPFVSTDGMNVVQRDHFHFEQVKPLGHAASTTTATIASTPDFSVGNEQPLVSVALFGRNLDEIS